MKCPIIGIFGQKENGKTTVAKMILELAHRDAIDTNSYILPIIRGFANPIKETLSRLTGLSLQELEEHKNSKTPLPGWNVTVRQAMQMLGKWGRDVKNDLLIEAALQPYRGILGPQTDELIIDDGRYVEELKTIKSKGGFTILIVKPDKWVDPHTKNLDSSEIGMGRAALAYKAVRGPLGYLGNTLEWWNIWCNEYKNLFDYVIWNDDTLVSLQDTVELIYKNHLRN